MDRPHELSQGVGAQAFQRHDRGGHDALWAEEILDGFPGGVNDASRLNADDGVANSRLAAGMPVDRRR